MSWSVTFNDFNNTSQLPVEVVEQMMTQHIAYPGDMLIALEMAKKVGVKTVVLTGCRTPNPYGNHDEVIDISIRGMVSAKDFNSMMREILAYGPQTGGNDQPNPEDDAG